jgi:tetratricopeptide (TPR) repeat protein
VRTLTKRLPVFAFAVFVLSLPLHAQKPSGAQAGVPSVLPGTNSESGNGHGLPDAELQPPDAARTDESCLMWIVVRTPAPTVSVAALQVPAKAKGEFGKACSDVKGKKFANAEGHLRKAVEEYPQYAAAWVLLGQVLEAGNQTEEAQSACSQASHVDPAYAPAYLCLADLSAQRKEWNETLNLTDRALALDPVQNVYGCFYSAMAQFHLDLVPEAEKNALRAIEADHEHRVPKAHLLLAQIYEGNNDFRGAASQLRIYLKAAPNSPESAGARKSLAELESKIPK